MSLKIVDPVITALGAHAKADFAISLASLLEREKVAYDMTPIATRRRACASGAVRRSK
jgi:hypothetical protein